MTLPIKRTNIGDMSPSVAGQVPFTRFADRRQAGQLLGRSLVRFADRPDVVVLGLARGGVPVAVEVARALHAPLDVVVVRKLGLPGQEEVAMGAVGPDGTTWLDTEMIERLRIPQSAIEQTIAQENRERQRRQSAYPASLTELTEKTVILVDDGLATGSTMQAVVGAMRSQKVGRIVVAVPVAGSDAVHRLEQVADEVQALLIPRNFMSVGQWYLNFDQLTDMEVIQQLTEGPSQ